MIKNKNTIVIAFLSLILALTLSAIFNYQIVLQIISTLTLGVFIIASYFDIREQEVDIKLLLVLLILSAVFNYFSTKDFVNLALSIAGSAIIPVLFSLLSREKWMGWGDVFFLSAGGAYLGIKLFYWGVVGSFLLAGLFGIILVATGSGNLKSRVPLAPFVLASLIIVKLISINYYYVFPF